MDIKRLLDDLVQHKENCDKEQKNFTKEDFKDLCSSYSEVKELESYSVQLGVPRVKLVLNDDTCVYLNLDYDVDNDNIRDISYLYPN